MTKLSAAVTFICDAPVHLASADAHGTLTVNGAAWAFCPSTLISGHKWRALHRSVAIYELRRGWRSFALGQAALAPATDQPSE